MATQGELDPITLIKAINPNMPPDQVVKNLKLANDIDSNETQSPVDQARDELLQRSGFDPAEWTWYTNYKPYSGQPEPTEQDMAMLKRPFPTEIEMVVIQGSFTGGVRGTPGVGSWSWSKYKYRPDEWTVFVRVKRQIEQLF